MSIDLRVYCASLPAPQPAPGDNVAIHVEPLAEAERDEHLATLTRTRLAARLRKAQVRVDLRASADEAAEMWRFASALAKKTAGVVFDPADGVWLTAKEAADRVAGRRERYVDDDEVQAVAVRLEERRTRGFRGGPAGVQIVHVGTGPDAVLIGQLMLMAVADIEEADAFNMAINCPLRILDGALAEAEAREVVRELRSLGIDARVVE